VSLDHPFIVLARCSFRLVAWETFLHSRWQACTASANKLRDHARSPIR